MRKYIVGILLLLGAIIVIVGFYLLQNKRSREISAIGTASSTLSSTVNEPKDLYLCQTKIGRIENGRIFIDFDGSTYSFLGDVKDLSLLGYSSASQCPSGLPSGWNHKLVYNNLLINLPKRDELVKITYVCDSPLSGIIFERCETNGKDRISEYEFGRAYLGKDYYNSWEKIFIKRVGDKNVVFQSVWGDFGLSDSLLYADKPSKNRSDFDLIAVHWSDVTPEQLGVYPSELFGLYKELRLYNLVEDMKIYENKLNYDVDEKWFKDLNLIRDKMVRTFHSRAYLSAITNEKIFKENDEKWNKIIDSFRLEVK